MCCRIGDLRNKQVVCVKNGCVLGFISDVEIASGVGYSKKESHQKAAEKALKLIDEDVDFEKKILEDNDTMVDEN